MYSADYSEAESQELLGDNDDSKIEEEEGDKYEICCTHSYL